jgi:hypothetical protein
MGGVADSAVKARISGWHERGADAYLLKPFSPC